MEIIIEHEVKEEKPNIQTCLLRIKVNLELLKLQGVKFRNIKSFWAQLNEKLENKPRQKKRRSRKLKRAHRELTSGNAKVTPVRPDQSTRASV